MATKLFYVGDGFLLNVPGRDLDESELPELPYTETELIATGLYALSPGDRPAPKLPGETSPAETTQDGGSI